jgi:uncharacterized Fe-S cluster-containing radical SAM superfamily protein
MKVWDAAEKKVLLSGFEGSGMERDSDGVYSKTEDFWRVKTYTKDGEKLQPMRKREFTEPYMAAQWRCGGTWNDYNAPCTVQVGRCNLDCYFCFVPEEIRSGRGRYFSAAEVLGMFEAARGPSGRGVLRISGGEPFLAPDFIAELGGEVANYNGERPGDPCYLWVDTNLLGRGYAETVFRLHEAGVPFGICGCFKGFDDRDFKFNTGLPESRLGEQFENAREILDALRGEAGGLIADGAVERGDLFFYVPEITQTTAGSHPPWRVEMFAEDAVTSFQRRMREEIHELAPLRTTVLSIKEYDVNSERVRRKWRGPIDRAAAPVPFSRFPPGLTRWAWLEEINAHYPLDLRWIPQYQVDLS